MNQITWYRMGASFRSILDMDKNADERDVNREMLKRGKPSAPVSTGTLFRNGMQAVRISLTNLLKLAIADSRESDSGKEMVAKADPSEDSKALGVASFKGISNWNESREPPVLVSRDMLLNETNRSAAASPMRNSAWTMSD